MRIPLPPAVREAWGDSIADAFILWLEDWGSHLIREKAVPRDEYREVLSRAEFHQEIQALRQEMLALHQATLEQLDRMQERMDRLQIQTQERMDLLRVQTQERMDRMQAQIQERMDREFAAVHERLDRMYHQMVIQTRWLIGALLGFGTIITVLLAIAQFKP